ncbi:MAG: hypothetical protein FWE06_04235 [Oscillospiraceae bacterium]|nr:hypothetical protein [Oscillospiraceae bacterium]
MKKKYALFFIMPFILVFMLQFIGLVIRSFTDFHLFVYPNFIWLDNYIRAFSDTLFTTALGNTLFLYALTSAIVGTILLFLYEIVRKRSKVAYYWCVSALLFLSLVYFWVNSNFLLFAYLGWIDTHRTLGLLLLYFVIATLGITAALLTIPLERMSKSLRPILAFLIPIIMSFLFEHNIRGMLLPGFFSTSRNTLTIRPLALDYVNVRLEIGYAAALDVLHRLLVIALIVIIVVAVKIYYKCKRQVTEIEVTASAQSPQSDSADTCTTSNQTDECV